MSTVRFELNGRPVASAWPPLSRLSAVLRAELGLTGTKVGCEAGDCGACTVLLDGRQICACLTALGQVSECAVDTVEGLAESPLGARLQASFLAHGAAQCGICSPGMLLAAMDLLRHTAAPEHAEILDALGGVLCRCTGYQKIVEAVAAVATDGPVPPATGPLPAGQAVGARLARVDGVAKLTGTERFGDDGAPAGALHLRVVRSPHARATFTVGDLAGFVAGHPGLVCILGARDVPGVNGFGVYPHVKDQPVFADGAVRYRGEAVLALVGEAGVVHAIDITELPIVWSPLPAVTTLAQATARAAPAVQAAFSDNVLTRGRLRCGDAQSALAAAPFRAGVTVTTAYVEHAYIEPEAGWARRIGARIEITVSTQSPYLDRDGCAAVLGISPEQVRIVPSACGGGFGGKLDMAVQPLVALAAWLTGQPVRAVFTRPESMAASTKRHPASLHAQAACDAQGKLLAYRFHGDFNTGAYASWGPTVADRVPVHCPGPYAVANVHAESRAILTNGPPSGAFRGFGIPQAAIAHEALMDELAAATGLDPLALRLNNALRAGDATPSGQTLAASAGLAECLRAVQPAWQDWRAAAERSNRAGAGTRRGVGIGCMWYGCGNTSLSNPSTIHLGIDRQGRITLYSGAVDIGQGANTVLAQIAADALGVPVALLHQVTGDTDRTADAGKSSASRQTLVSGKAAELAGQALRAEILRLTNAGSTADIEVLAGRLRVGDAGATREVDLTGLPAVRGTDVLLGVGHFDPPTTPLDEDGQGQPYATYGFAAQIAEIEVDTVLGTVRVVRMLAAHDVGRAINPTQVEGQIHGGIAQGIGLALMEEYLPGETDNLHDYLIPTIGDMPAMEVILVEDPEPVGPRGAKGIGEPALIPTAPAILGAIAHATGVRITQVPATPARVRAAIAAHAAQRSGGVATR